MTRLVIESVKCINPEKSWFRFYSNESTESKKAYKLLFDEIFFVTSLPVSGLAQPRLEVESFVYNGLEEIEGLVVNLKRYYNL